MSARHTDLWLKSNPRQAGLILSLNTGLFSAPAAAAMPNRFGSAPSCQSHERWKYPTG